MNKLIFALALSFFMISCNKKVATTPSSEFKVQLIENDWTGAKSKANTDDKNIVLMLHAVWCNHCKTFIRDVIADNDVAQELEGKIVFSFIDAEKGDGPSLMSAFNSNSFPTFVVCDKNGNQITKRNGATSKEEFLAFVNPYLK